jgi:two-component system invasion response regulator UvrY
MLHNSLVIVDDHRLFSSALSELIQKDKRYEVLYEVASGKDLIERMRLPQNIPDIILLDINMPVMDGYEIASWLKEKHPDVKVLALSMNNDEQSIVRMIRAGVRGYLLKDTGPTELNNALAILCEKGFYYSELVTHHMVNNLVNGDQQSKDINSLLSDREAEFLNHACSEMTYKEIADKMFLSARTIDGYREALFEKLNVKSRVGLVLYAISHKLVNPDRPQSHNS